MQTVTIYRSTSEGLQPVGPEHGPESGSIARLRASHELEQKSILQSMQDNAMQHKQQGNAAMESMQYRHAVREYNRALEHARAMAEFLEVDRPPPMNGYQLRALARGQELPKRGPEALEPFCALVHANRSLAFLRLNAYERAIDDAAEACRLLPKYLKAWVRRSAALAAANRREDALAVLDEALERACPNEMTKEQVCKLIVNVRSLGSVEVKPPERDLPVVFKGGRSPKSRAAKKEVVHVPLEMMRSCSPGKGGEITSGASKQAFSEVGKRDVDAWHVTHLGGRWRQAQEEIDIVLALPRRPKPAELLVQIRPQHIWVLLRKAGATGEGGQDDYESVCDAALAGAVRPAESTWTLEASGSPELRLSLPKQGPGGEASGGAAQNLWDRAFEDDEPLDLAGLACAEAAAERPDAPAPGSAPRARPCAAGPAPREAALGPQPLPRAPLVPPRQPAGEELMGPVQLEAPP